MLHIDFIVNQVYSSRTYILSEDYSSDIWLIDCGDFDKVLKKINNKGIKGVLLTHVHFDHIYGLPELLKRFPDCVIYTNTFGLKALSNDKTNMSRYNGTPVSFIPVNHVLCSDMTIIKLFEHTKAIVYETPGHNPSCLSFVVSNFFFTGDAYIPMQKVVTILPYGNKNKAAETLDRISELSKNHIICPGH